MTYWQIARPLMLMGIGMPLFFVPVTVLALGAVEESEMASAAGLMNFLRTLSGAVATSIVQTAWENHTAVMHAELSGLVDANGETAQTLAHAGVSADYVRLFLDHLTQGQAVMLATNEVMGFIAVSFAFGALFIWLAPRPLREVNAAAAGH
jgi:DHA2 family multidrug resistance protein